MYDVIVIGGGIVGMATAYHLVAAGARTLLVDRADAGQATAAGAGILSPETSRHESDDWFGFAVSAVDYYPTLIAQLAADGAVETGYAPVEELIVAVSEDEDAQFAAACERITARQRMHNRPAAEDLRPIAADAARALFPPLATVRSALHFRRAARVDGRLLTNALRQAAVGRGLVLRQAGVERLVVQNGRVEGVMVSDEQIPSGAVVIAGGAWSQQFGAQLGLALPIAPQRGQIIHLSLPGTETAHWPVITAFHGHYILPWPDGRVVVGATREQGGFAPHTTAAGIREVLDEALRVAPGLADAAIADIRVGLRPSTPDSLPVLGAVPTVANVYLVTGHGANGLQLGPFSGKVIAGLALGAEVRPVPAAFAVARFL